MNPLILARRVAITVLVIFGTVAVEAQIAGVVPVPKPTEVVFMGWERAQGGLFTTQDGREFSPLEAPAYDFGKPSRIRPDTPLRIYQKIQRDGKPTYEVVGEADLPPGCLLAQAYLVRQADKDDLRSYRVVAMSNDADAFKAGDVRVFNFSPYAAMIKVGSGEALPLGSLEWRTVAGGADHKYRVPLVTTLQIAGGWARAVRNVISVRPGQRGQVTIVHTQAEIGEIGASAGVARMMVLATSEYVRLQPAKEPASAGQFSAVMR